MDSSITQQVMIIVAGTIFTLLIWGAVGWWMIAEQRKPEHPPLAPKPRDEPAGVDDHSELR